MAGSCLLSEERPLAIDLFAGAGGLGLGFEEAGFDVAAAVEFDPVHAAVHEYNFPQTKMFCADIRCISGDDLRDKSRIGDKEVAVVFGGPPCQGISLIGKRDIKDMRNELIMEFVRIVEEIRPCYCVMENVAGLVVGEHRSLLDAAAKRLKEIGYQVPTPQVLQAADYGVPQSRKRLFLIGARMDMPLVGYPKPTSTPRRIDGGKVHGTLPVGPSVSDALCDLPNADCFEELLRSDAVLAEYGEPSPYSRKLRFPETDAQNYAGRRRSPANLLTSSARTKHTDKSITRFNATKPGSTEKVSRFLRLHPDGVSNTLRAGTSSDRGAYTAPRPIHPFYPRVITVREAARLHGYPDWFRFHVTKWNGFREVGNSVPVPLARAVAESVIKGGAWQQLRPLPYDTGDERLLCLTQREAECHFGLDRRVIPQRKRRNEK